MKKVTLLDISMAIVVLISLAGIKTHTIFWISYAFACFIYTGINYTKKLYGQGTMNIIAGIIAIINYIR